MWGGGTRATSFGQLVAMTSAVVSQTAGSMLSGNLPVCHEKPEEIDEREFKNSTVGKGFRTYSNNFRNDIAKHDRVCIGIEARAENGLSEKQVRKSVPQGGDDLPLRRFSSFPLGAFAGDQR